MLQQVLVCSVDATIQQEHVPYRLFFLQDVRSQLLKMWRQYRRLKYGSVVADVPERRDRKSVV